MGRSLALKTLSAELANFRLALCSQSFNSAVLLDFPNVIGANGSNSDSETSHFV